MATKGPHLQGEDTRHKQALMKRLTAACSDERWQRVGSLELEGGSAASVVCDLVFDRGWQGRLAARQFNRDTTAASADWAAPAGRGAAARRAEAAESPC